jgi:uncharacterized phage protein (TIGR01671 family)
MREIKFRAWDKELNQMGYVTCIDYFHELHYPNLLIRFVYYDTEEEFNFVQKGDNIELMQYTGLKDKNGVEIYEVDIVEFYAQAPWDYEIPIKVKGTITFGDPFPFSFCVLSDENTMCLYEIERELVVVGNIYENPELLK